MREKRQYPHINEEVMNDTIIISPITCQCLIGILPHEKTAKQTVVIHIHVIGNTQTAGKSDDITDSVIDYSQVIDTISDRVQSKQYNLIEACAEDVAYTVLRLSQKIASVIVEIEKPEIYQRKPNIRLKIKREKC